MDAGLFQHHELQLAVEEMSNYLPSAITSVWKPLPKSSLSAFNLLQRVHSISMHCAGGLEALYPHVSVFTAWQVADLPSSHMSYSAQRKLQKCRAFPLGVGDAKLCCSTS